MSALLTATDRFRLHAPVLVLDVPQTARPADLRLDLMPDMPRDLTDRFMYVMTAGRNLRECTLITEISLYMTDRLISGRDTITVTATE